VLVPDPVVIIPPGVLVNVQVPFAGNPVNITLPVAEAHVGGVMLPTTGAPGVNEFERITILADAADIQPDALVTV
jgi:hypothetical protein